MNNMNSFSVNLIISSPSLLAETNRSQFNFAEGPSKLVFVFNVEYPRGEVLLFYLYLNKQIFF